MRSTFFFVNFLIPAMSTKISPNLIQHQIVTMISLAFKCAGTDIKNMEVIYLGHSSIVLCFQILNKEPIYCVRWNLSKTQLNWRNEYYYIQGSDLKSQYVYFDFHSGHYIKEFLPGKSLEEHDLDANLWTQIMHKLAIFHYQKLSNKQAFGYSPYNAYLNESCPLKGEDLELFVKIGELNNNLPIVFAHNSLNLKNILYDGLEICFVDFEWVAHNNPYVDVASLILDANLNEEQMRFLLNAYNKHAPKKLAWNTLGLFVYFVASLNYQWAHHFESMHEPTTEVATFKKQAFLDMAKYKKLFYLKNWLQRLNQKPKK